MRLTAEDRREAILEAATHEFARTGLHGTSVETIAKAVGVSQPYVFRLFGTKKDLFLAATDRGFNRVRDAFQTAVRDQPDNPLHAMGEAYMSLLAERSSILLQLQAYAAADDPDVQRIVQRRYSELVGFVQGASHASEDEVWRFFACGMLLTVGAAVDLPFSGLRREADLERLVRGAAA
ncbi:MAG TPA: TetR/AcrR family transcriptional regulator [Chloroflexota bacterium]|jgi:AcrR family transcriptional regulator|nr:TetR/AcrR family transcriptional regulator [Chloroflexota bacterium]